MTAPAGSDVGAWLLKCRPHRWDLDRYISDGNHSIHSWTISQPDSRLAAGQPVLFWVTGSAGASPTPGLWGAGVITGQYRIGRDHADGYWLTPPAKPGSTLWLPVDITLFRQPVPRTVLADDPRLHRLQILTTPVAGNPQQVTSGQLTVIGRYLDHRDTASYGSMARARAVVMDVYRRRGWHVERATAAGWDLTCRHGAYVLRVVARPADEIIIGRAEAAAAADPDWRLIVVDGSRLIEYDGNQALDHAEPIGYWVPPP